MQNDSNPSVKKNSEEILMQLRLMSPDILLIIRSAITNDVYANTFQMAENTLGLVFVKSLSRHIEELRNADVLKREVALMELGRIGYSIQDRINNHFSQLEYNPYFRPRNKNWNSLDKGIAKYLFSFFDQDTQMKFGSLNKFWCSLNKEINEPLNTPSRNTGVSPFFNSPRTGNLTPTASIKDSTDSDSETTQSYSSEDDSHSGEGMTRLNYFTKG